MRDGIEARGEFVELDPPHRLVFTWGWQDNPVVPPGSTTVEVTLQAIDDGTLVRLVHRGLPTPTPWPTAARAGRATSPG